MAYKEINPEIWTYEKDGDFIEGIYRNLKSNVGPNKSMFYTIETGDGMVHVWGSTILDSRMLEVNKGDKVKITYKGLGQATSGKQAPKIFKVEVDKEAKEEEPKEEAGEDKE